MQQPVYKNPNVPDTDDVYRTNIVLWAGMLISQLLFLVVVFFSKRELFGLITGEGSIGESSFYLKLLSTINPMLIVLAVVGLITFILSFVLKARLIQLAIDNKQTGLVQTAQILAYALCEATALFGLIAAFAFDSPLFLAWFAVGILGLLLHFPRRGNFAAASFTGIN